MAEFVKDEELEEVSGGNWKNEYFMYEVVAGDTLSGIAIRFGTNVNKLLRLNSDKITNPDVIKVGWQLRVPTSKKTGWI